MRAVYISVEICQHGCKLIDSKTLEGESGSVEVVPVLRAFPKEVEGWP